ncbi:MAG: RimK family alpha-L-glutamate ligase [Bacteroidales bacterium]
MNILLLTDSTDSNATMILDRAFESRGHTVTKVRPSDLSLLVSNNASGFDRVYLERKGIVSRILSKEFDLVYPRISGNLRYGVAALDHLKNNVGIHCPIPTVGLLCASDKFFTTQRVSQAGIRTPLTLLFSGSGSVELLIDKVGGVPVVVKQLTGSQGDGVSILDSKRAVKSTLESFAKSGIRVLLQEYIESAGRDFRVFVVGNRVVAAYQRIAPREDFRANISGGGKGVPAKITKEEEFMCLLAAQAVGLPVAGVDFIRSKNGEPYLIEVNGNPGLHVQKVTGIDVAQAIVSLVEQDFAKHQKDRPRHQQERWGTQELMNDLTVQAKKVSRMLDPVVKDEYLKSILAHYRGQTLDYVDCNGQTRQRKLNTLTDLITVMSQTFKIE